MLQGQRIEKLPHETGGFLLGMRRGPHIEITGATVEGPDDYATKYSFERRDEVHGRTAVTAWEAAGGTVGLVGDWHSHPFGPPTPSGTDRSAWRKLGASIGCSAVGIILAEGEPGVFLAPRRWSIVGALRCRVVEEDNQELVFGARLWSLLSPIPQAECHP